MKYRDRAKLRVSAAYTCWPEGYAPGDTSYDVGNNYLFREAADVPPACTSDAECAGWVGGQSCAMASGFCEPQAAVLFFGDSDGVWTNPGGPGAPPANAALWVLGFGGQGVPDDELSRYDREGVYRDAGKNFMLGADILE